MMSPDLSFPLSLSSTCLYGWGREGIIATHHSGQCVLSHFSHVQLFATLWTVAHQTPLSMGLLRQEYWSGLPFPSPRNLPDPGIELGSPALKANSLPSEPPGKPRANGGTCQSISGRQATLSLVRGEGRSHCGFTI